MLLVRLHVFLSIDDQFSTIDYVRYASDVILRLLEHELLHFAWNAPGRGRGDPVNFPQFRRRRNRLLDEWHEVFSQHCRVRSEEHTSELQSHHDLVCRLLLEKKNKKKKQNK